MDAVRGPREHPGGDAVGCQLGPLPPGHRREGRQVLRYLAALYLHLGLVELLGREHALGEVLVGHYYHRELVLLRQIVGFGCQEEAFLHVPRGEDDPGEIALRGMEREAQVALLGPGRHAGARPYPLRERDDDGRLGYRSHAEGLHHQREPPSGGADHRPDAGVRGPDRIVYRGYLVLRLLDDEAEGLLVLYHIMQDSGSGRHGVSGVELASGLYRAEGYRLVPGYYHGPLVGDGLYGLVVRDA